MIICVQVSQWYDLVVFTASMEVYGSAVADKLDRNKGILKRRYYRQVMIFNILIYRHLLINILIYIEKYNGYLQIRVL